MSNTHCVKCGNAFYPRHFYDAEKTKPIDTGYAQTVQGERVCFECAALDDLRVMRETGKHDLYLTKNNGQYEISNWPGTLRFGPVNVSKGHHNIAGTRLDVWFSFNGHVWHGINLGEWNQVCRVKQTKEVSSRSSLLQPKGG